MGTRRSTKFIDSCLAINGQRLASSNRTADTTAKDVSKPELNKEPLLEMLGITKSFPGVRALDGVTFDLFPGEIHALVGENGAGKSTLIKILGGVYTEYDGEICISGNSRHFRSVRE